MLRLNQAQAGWLLEDYDRTGLGFVAGETKRPAEFGEFGDCIASRQWVMRELAKIPTLELLLYMEPSWLGQVTLAEAKPWRVGASAA